MRIGPVFAVTNTLGTIVPSLHPVFDLLTHIYVSVAMWAFLELLCLMVVQVKSRQHTADLAMLLDPEDYHAEVLRSLSDQPPLRLWAAPPLGCCFHLPCLHSTPCGSSSRPTMELLTFTRGILVGYMLLMPQLPALRMLLHVARAHHPFIAISLAIFESVLSVIALYALFIIYHVTHEPLHAYQTTLKFVAIKSIVLMLPPQRLLARALFEGHENEVVSNFWLSCVQALEAPLLCWLIGKAYPKEELNPHIPGGPEQLV
eukprot:CAMPEP_0115840420 /NCGR_PEP_ID=MMETSP0287-20121206/6761_1 /TAXON_ID=412157 /ORGANISM="Chrysochromulina rotalis, Strain UIO044" /LENGTH=258 /DNA_ID=CAMNT_0003294029 /DNA_START=197 /DNA_END=973 /DNA_ORIENTATION=+